LVDAFVTLGGETTYFGAAGESAQLEREEAADPIRVIARTVT
jgi:hypothetical protein